MVGKPWWPDHWNIPDQFISANRRDERPVERLLHNLSGAAAMENLRFETEIRHKRNPGLSHHYSRFPSYLIPLNWSLYLRNMKSSHTRKTIKAYNKNAEKYAEKFTYYETYINKMLEFQDKYIANDANILDLGCGPGNNIKTILEQNASCNFTGVDLSEKFIKIAGNKYPQFTFIHEDIRNIDLKTKYDIVLASFCIVHLSNEETEELLKKISSLLKDESCLYLSYMNGERQGFETTSFSNEEIFFNYYQDQYIIEILNLNNLMAVEISKEEYVEADGSTTTDTFIYLITTFVQPELATFLA